MGKSEVVASILANPLTHRVWTATDARRGMVRILAYHRVLDETPETFAFDEALISASSETFQQQMEFARRNFEVITFADLYQCEQAGRPWPKRSLIVTFDDGYADNYTHAFPILRALNLPATIFIATSYMGANTRLFWWDLVAYCVKKTPRTQVNLPHIQPQPLPLATLEQQRQAILDILRWVKQVPEATKNEFLDGLSHALEVELPTDVAAGMHLTWEQIKAMAAGGIEFGSHSVTHPILANVSEEQLKREICDSKLAIEQQLGKRVLVISYPDGRQQNYNQKVQQVAAAAGFHYGICYDEGPALEKGGDPFAIPRIHVESDQSPSLFHANLMYPKIMLLRRAAARQPRTRRGTRRRHVMEVTWSLVAGGSEVYAFTVASHLDPKRYRATLCAIDEGGALESEIKASPIPYYIMRRRPGLDFRLMWRLFRLFRRLRVDVLHTHHFNQLFYSALGAKLLGIRIIHTEHDTEIQKRPRLRLALKFLSRFCYRMIAIGNDIATMFETQIGIPAEKIETVRAGVNLTAYNQSRSAARQSLGLREQDRVAVIVARLYPEKNHLLLLRAFADVAREVENARLLIVGEGTERAAIRAVIEDLGLTDKAQMLGVRRDVALILAASDVFALSSNREGLPIAILEAMAAGCPVVATRVGDVPEVVQDGFNGYLVPPQDQAALTHALIKTLNNPEQAACLGANARATAQDYSVRAMIDKYETLFEA